MQTMITCATGVHCHRFRLNVAINARLHHDGYSNYRANVLVTRYGFTADSSEIHRHLVSLTIYERCQGERDIAGADGAARRGSAPEPLGRLSSADSGAAECTFRTRCSYSRTLRREGPLYDLPLSATRYPSVSRRTRLGYAPPAR